MSRISVKNTFLTLEEDPTCVEDECAAVSGAVIRCRSTGHSPRNNEPLVPNKGQMERLNLLLTPIQKPAEGSFCASGDTRMWRTMSNNSVTTMASDSVSDWTMSPVLGFAIPHVNSSGSVSSMVSGLECSDFGEGAGFDFVIQEEPSMSTQLVTLPQEQREREVVMPVGGEVDLSPVAAQPPNPALGDDMPSRVHKQKQPEQQYQQQQQQRHLRWLQKDYRHGHVPKNIDLAEAFSKQSHGSPPTTLMIRNIPNRYSQSDLIQELEDLDLVGAFDFLYIPLDKGTMSNVGYAFVNFVEHAFAMKCMSALADYQFKRHRKGSGKSGKVASVSVAHMQGLEANIRHYENAAVNTVKLKQRRPMIMANIAQALTDSSPQ